MQVYREISQRAFRAEFAYAQLLRFESRAENDSGQQLAETHDTSRSALYAPRAKVLRALRPAEPGPRPRSDDAIARQRAQDESQALRTSPRSRLPSQTFARNSKAHST